MPNSFLTNKNLELILFGGKGGTGKTTSATATALYLAQTTKKKILIVSTDPAPSIGDSFDVEVGNKITQISAPARGWSASGGKGGSAFGGKDNVWALEMDAKELFEDFRKKNLKKIETLILRGTYLSKGDVEMFENLSLPGMDEVMAIIKIADLLKNEEYDLIILDTAPTGHTKVLLSLPEKIKRWIKVLDIMQEKHRFLKRHWAGRYVKDECDRFLEDFRQDINRVKDLFENHNLTEFVPVIIPEPMSILETDELIKDLQEMGMKIESIIVNRILFPGECSFCAKRASQKEKYMKMIEERFGEFQLLKMPLFPTEVRGEKDLREFSEILFGKKKYQPTLPKKVLSKFSPLPEGKMSNLLQKDLNLIICGGKGGVGKTSITGACTIALARKYKDKKILVSTTDPAHALSNIFDQDIPIGGGIVSIKGFNNLEAIEIDAQKILEKFKDEYRQDIEVVFKEFVGGGVDIVFDKRVLEELMELSPPGLEELMALGKITDLMKEERYDIYVLDSAASGHLLRFLEIPGIIRGWLKSIFKILLKYREMTRLTKIKARLLDLSRDVKRIQETLFGSKTTEFIMISIAEEMGIREMRDLEESLKRLNVLSHYIILNMINPVSRCRFCSAKRENQEKYISKVKKEYPKKEIVLVPLLTHDIQGIDSLNKLSKIIFGT